MSNNQIKVVIFCVNYNSYDKTIEYLESINKAATQSDTADVTVVIADNSNPVLDIEKDFENLHILHIVTNANLGYLGAVVYAIKESHIELEKYNYIVISNVDLTIKEDFFDRLSTIVQEKNVGCIAPSIYSISEQYDRNPKMLAGTSRKKLKLLYLMYSIPLLYTINYRFISKKKYEKKEYNERMKIYAPHGSFMIFTPQFASFLQTFEYPAFLFGEEIFFAENLRLQGLDVVYEPALKVVDYDHVSTGQLKSKLCLKWNRQAICMLLEEYFNE